MKEKDIEDALIHLRVPRETKGRWVALSRNEGKKLTDWITDAVESMIEQRDLTQPGVIPEPKS